MGLHRLHLRVPAAHVAAVRAAGGEDGQKRLLADIAARLRHLGAGAVLLVTQDPTHPERFTALARVMPQTGDNAVQILGAEPVEEPPARLPPPDPRWPLDPGLTSDETTTVQDALRHERNARHLGGIATTLEPTFPAAASLLRAKAQLIEQRVRMDPARVGQLLADVYALPPSAALGPMADRFAAHAALGPVPVPLLRDDVRRNAVALLEDPRARLDGPPFVQALARALVQPLSAAWTSLPVVTPHALHAALPPRADDGFVSPSALQLVLASQKPIWSGVQRSDRIAGVLDAIQQGTDLNAARARQQIARAEGAIGRRRWVEWYRRRRAAGLGPV